MTAPLTMLLTLAVVASLSVPGSALAQPRDPFASVAPGVAAHQDGDALRALGALPAAVRDGARARYLRGRLLERLGRLAEAADALAGDGDDLPPELQRDARRRRARLLARSGRCGDALPLLAAMATAHELDATGRALAAECELTAGDRDTAIGKLRQVAREDARPVDTFAVRLLLAEALQQSGDTGAAVDELRSLLVDRPEHPDAARAEAQLTALGATFEPDLDQRLARAERLLDTRHYRASVEELDRAGRPADRTRLKRWLHLRGMALFGTRHDYAEAAQVLGEAARLRGTDGVDDAFHAARALARSDQDDQAIAAFRRIVARYPRHARAAESEYLAAWLEILHGRSSGEARMRRFLAGPRARGHEALVRDATWHLAFRAFERGRFRDAARGFARYADLGEGALIRGRGLYWLGRARAGAGDRDGAIEAWRATLGVEALHWYGLLARQRLVAVGVDPGPPLPRSRGPAEPELVPPRLPDDVTVYAQLGLREDAVAALRRKEGVVRESAPHGREREALVAAYAALGEPARPYRLVATAEHDALSHRPAAASRWAWDAAYPRPWRTVVAEAARAHGIRPEQLYAVMRQESGYDRDAVSYAGAVGLLQMLPSTAERVARRLGTPFSEEMLFEPEVNVHLAAAENADLMRRFGGVLPLAVGAYNAGAARMRRWLTEAGEMDLDRFVERISIDQTRNYIRRVTSHYARYMYLDDPDAGWPDVPLPEHVGTPADASDG